MPTRPVIKDLAGWTQQLCHHRLALLERLIEEFPQVLKTHRSAIEILRIQLRVRN
jgi:hypothetical protein